MPSANRRGLGPIGGQRQKGLADTRLQVPPDRGPRRSPSASSETFWGDVVRGTQNRADSVDVVLAAAVVVTAALCGLSRHSNDSAALGAAARPGTHDARPIGELVLAVDVVPIHYIVMAYIGMAYTGGRCSTYTLYSHGLYICGLHWRSM